jgi:hypothetical protein
MNCPKCESENIVMVGELAHCRSCENYYKPHYLSEPAKVSPPASATRRNARQITIMAGILLGIGAFFLIAGITSWTIWAMVTFGACWTLAFWLYVLAQIIHIRANTEK